MSWRMVPIIFTAIRIGLAQAEVEKCFNCDSIGTLTGYDSMVSPIVADIKPLPKVSIQAFSVPKENEFSVGDVKTHQLASKQPWDYSIFIIGDDKRSIKWLQHNQRKLKKIHALGIVAHFSKGQRKEQLQQQYGLPLIVAQLNGLAEIIKTHHYPVLIYQGWVLQ